MTKTVTIGRRLIPVEHIALVEPFDPSAHPGMKTEKVFKARVVLLDRQSVLTEETPKAFAVAQDFRILSEEGVGFNPAIHFQVETFTPAENFVPSKPFKSRVIWRDLDGNTQSKLLLSEPPAVLAIAVTGKLMTEDAAAETSSKPAESQAGSRGGSARKPTASIDRRKARRRPAEAVPF